MGAEAVTCMGATVPSRALVKFEAHDGEVGVVMMMRRIFKMMIMKRMILKMPQVMSVKWDWTGRCFATSGADRKIKIWEVVAVCVSSLTECCVRCPSDLTPP